MLTTFSKREQDKYAKAGSVAEEVLSCIRTVTSFNGQAQDIQRFVTKKTLPACSLDMKC